MNVEGVIKSIKRGVVSPVYLLFGEERYLRDQLVKEFIKHLLPADVRDFNLDLVDGKEKNLTEIRFMAESLPFIAEKRLIIVKDAPYFKPKKKNVKGEQEENQNNNDDEAFLAYLENPNPTTVIIFLADEGIDKRKKIVTYIAKKGQIVEFFTLKHNDLKDWLKEQIRLQGKKIEKEALEKLIINAGYDLRQLKTEVEKLVTYMGEEEVIKTSYIDELVAKKIDHNVFQIINEVGAKNYVEAIGIIREMLFLGEQPVKILQMIGKQYRIMLQVKELSKLGYSEKQIAEFTSSHPYVVQKSLKASRNFQKEELEEAVVKTREFDYKIKSGQLEANLALELYLMG